MCAASPEQKGQGEQGGPERGSAAVAALRCGLLDRPVGPVVEQDDQAREDDQDDAENRDAAPHEEAGENQQRHHGEQTERVDPPAVLLPPTRRISVLPRDRPAAYSSVLVSSPRPRRFGPS